MSETVLQTENLTKYYGKKLALDHLNLSLPKGTVCGFVGRNGAGKTTAIKLLLGFLRPTAGSSKILGCDSMSLTPDIRKRVGYVTEGHRLFGSMTIRRIEQFQRAFYDETWDSSLFANMMEYFELSPDQKIKNLSNGQRAQVSLALTLAPNPELLIMDDPTLGLDTAIRREFLSSIIELINRQGRTVLFSSHILSDVERVCDRIVVLDKGRLRASCTLEQFRNKICKIRLTYEKSPAPPDEAVEAEIDGVLRCKRNDNELVLTIVDPQDEQLEKFAEKTSARDCSPVSMNIEDQFIEFTAPAKKSGLFQWEKVRK